MAITRAQKAKQLLANGGRIGLKGGADAATESFARSYDRAVGNRPGTTKGRKGTPNVSAGGASFNRLDDAPSKDVRDRQRAKYNLQFIEKGKRPPGSKKGIISNLRDKAYLSGLQKNKVLALRKLGLMDPQALNLYGALFQSFEGLPEMYQGLSQKELNDLAMEVNKMKQYSGGTLSMPTLSKSMLAGQDLLGRISKFEDAMAKGTANQKLYDELFPGPKPRPDDAGGPSDPCLGPNPPSYCFIGKKADQTVAAQNAIARNLGGLSPRIGGSLFNFTGMADGGRVSAMDGGIMDMVREEMFLGGIVKGIKKGLKGATRAIKKVAKSPFGKAALLAAPFLMSGGLPSFLKGDALKSFFLKNADKGFSLANLSDKGVFAGIAGLSALAGLTAPKQDEDEFDLDAYYASSKLDPNPDIFPRILGSQFAAADGGRAGYKEGSIESGAMMSEKEMKKLAKSPLYKGFKKMYGIDPSMARDNPAYDEKFSAFEELFKKGFQDGGDVEPVAKKTMPLLDMGGQEMDLRAEGGFVPIGRMEKADDVPARLSKNEFVFTAEAVRNAGDGDVDKGAEVMYNMMKNLEDGGNVSDESQGLEGAQRMFQTSKRLEEVL